MEQKLIDALYTTLMHAEGLRKQGVEVASTYKPESIPSIVSFSGIDLDSPSMQEYDRKEGELRSYLHSIDFEIVKDIQAVMYLGRDRDYDRSATCDEIFGSERRYMDSLGWMDKDIEIEKVIEKSGRLNEYLRNGIDIIGI